LLPSAKVLDDGKAWETTKISPLLRTKHTQKDQKTHTWNLDHIREYYWVTWR